MELAREIAGVARLADLRAWPTTYDFEAANLDARARLVRLEYAVVKALEQATDPVSREELSFTLADCRALLVLESLEGEGAERNRVLQRMERIRRVVVHHEGDLARLNRRYWWVPCSLGLLLMLVGFAVQQGGPPPL